MSGVAVFNNSLIVNNSASINGMLTVQDLTINGTTTTVDTTNMAVEDTLIELSSGTSGTTSTNNDSGLLVNRGAGYNNAFIGWNETSDKLGRVQQMLLVLQLEQ